MVAIHPTRLSRAALLAVFCISLFASSLSAQTTNARLSGTVRDSEGAAIPDATLTIMNVGTNQAMVLHSNATGEYANPSLTPGRYRATVERECFQKVEQTGIVLTVSQDATLNVTLRPGNVTETVNVEAGLS